NIDRPFMVAVIVGGVFYILHPTSDNVGVLVGITAVLVFWAFGNNLFVFKNPVPYPKGTGLLILLSIILALIPVFVFKLTFKNHLNLPIFMTTFLGILQSYLVLNVFEEVIFRGALWV